MIKVIIFDLDGTIIDSELYLKKYIYRQIKNNKLKKFFKNKIKNEEIEPLFSKLLGMNFSDMYDFLNNIYDIKITKSEFKDLANSILKKIYLSKVKLAPNFKRLINKLYSNNYIIVLASSASKSLIDIALEKFSLNKYFRLIVSSNDVKGHSKPDPEIYKIVLDKLKVKPKECVVIEDAENGIIAAKKARMFAIGIRNGYNDAQNFKRADFIIKNFKEITLDFIKNNF